LPPIINWIGTWRLKSFVSNSLADALNASACITGMPPLVSGGSSKMVFVAYENNEQVKRTNKMGKTIFFMEIL
jgi:hypothetical protein